MKASFFLSVIAVVAIALPEVTAFYPPDDYYYAGGFDVSDNAHLDLSGNKIIPLEDEEKPRAGSTGMNHYTTIGMPLADNGMEEFLADTKAIVADQTHLGKVLLPDTLSRIGSAYYVNTPMKNRSAHYVCYASNSGAQLWGEVHTKDEGTHFGGFVPHFEGKSRVDVCLISKKEDPFDFDDGTTGEDVLDGGLKAVFEMPDGEATKFILDEIERQDGQMEFCQMTAVSHSPGEGIMHSGFGFMNPETDQGFFAFDFDCPNFGFLDKGLELPIRCTIQLSAFAREIITFGSVEEYHDSVSKDNSTVARDGLELNTHLASQFFGSANQDEKKEYACIVGHVVQTELKTNELTGKSFYWALVRTAGDIEIDVVIHPGFFDLFDLKPPQVGGVIQGYFWLSGLLLLRIEHDETTDNGSDL